MKIKHIDSTMPSYRQIEVYALLWLTRECEGRIRNFLYSAGVPIDAIQRGMHLTVYYGRRSLPGLPLVRKRVTIMADVSETRFMVLAPGGENPRPELEPARRSVGIRLTKRNSAIVEIQKMRQSIYKLETRRVIGTRKRTTAWTSCFGARHYQPHMKLLHPGSEIERDLRPLGESFRSAFNEIAFGKYEVRVRWPSHGNFRSFD